MDNNDAWLSVRLFGSLALTVEDPAGRSEPIALAGRPRNLFAYLALSGPAACHRTALSEVLWSEDGPAARAGTFNTALWRLRHAIETPPFVPGELIQCDRSGRIVLRFGQRLRTDVACFAELVTPALAKPAEALNESDIGCLERGVSMYAGDVLAGFSDDWALREREKHRRRQLNALGRLVQAHASRGDGPAAIRHAHAILEIDPLREDVHRELMRLYVQTGQRALALRQFEVCRAALRHELAIAPMAETVELYQGTVRGALAGSSCGPASHGLTAADVPSSDDRPVTPTSRLASDPTLLPTAALIAAARSHLAQAELQLKRALASAEASAAACLHEGLRADRPIA